MPAVASFTICQVKRSRCDKCLQPVAVGTRMGVIYSKGKCIGWWCPECVATKLDDTVDETTPNSEKSH